MSINRFTTTWLINLIYDVTTIAIHHGMDYLNMTVFPNCYCSCKCLQNGGSRTVIIALTYSHISLFISSNREHAFVLIPGLRDEALCVIRARSAQTTASYADGHGRGGPHKSRGRGKRTGWRARNFFSKKDVCSFTC